MIDFDNKLSSLIFLSLGEHSIEYSRKEYPFKIALMGKVILPLKNMGYLVSCEKIILFSFIQLINLKINWTLTLTDDWKDKCIASEFSISFLIDNNNLNMFPDWDCWPGLIDDIPFDEY